MILNNTKHTKCLETKCTLWNVARHWSGAGHSMTGRHSKLNINSVPSKTLINEPIS